MNSPTPALTLTSTEQRIVDLNLPDITASPEPMPEPVSESSESPRELSPFEQRAIPMIERNIPVIPLRPRTKIAFLQGWEELASTDPKQVAAWNEIDHDLNAACVAKAVPGGV
jgi:Bifunctional DNA primase/polymerase, N-terminal